MPEPRLITLDEARRYLGGRHPATLGCTAIGRLWDRREIDARLDARAGIDSLFRPPAAGVPANDISGDEGELADLADRITADAAGRV